MVCPLHMIKQGNIWCTCLSFPNFVNRQERTCFKTYFLPWNPFGTYSLRHIRMYQIAQWHYRDYTCYKPMENIKDLVVMSSVCTTFASESNLKLLTEKVSFVGLAKFGEPTPLSTSIALCSSSDGACPPVASWNKKLWNSSWWIYYNWYVFIGYIFQMAIKH